MEEMNRYNVYIVLTKTGTNVAKLIRMYTKEPYSHVSLSFDENLEPLYSFARRKIKNPLNAGFIEEHIDSGIFGLYKDVECAVYCLNIPKEAYDNVQMVIKELKYHHMDYGYNFTGLFSAAINLPYSSPKKFFCSQFVAWILGSSGVSICNKEYSLTRPEDFRKCLEQYKIYEGNLHSYNHSKEVTLTDTLKKKQMKMMKEVSGKDIHKSAFYRFFLRDC